MSMSTPNDNQANDRDFLRRDFVKTGAGIAALGLAQTGRVLGANDRVRLAICGLRGRGKDHLNGFAKVPGVEIAAVCDIDENIIATRMADFEKLGLPKPKTYTDVRKLLEDKSIDAISVATPNHWHSLMGIWACQAGKDAYVEKPISHNIYEGRQLVAAAAHYNRIIQCGSQTRSNEAAREAMAHLKNGLIGEVYLSRGLCFKWRDTIGRKPRTEVPKGVDYNLWLGPAPDRGFTMNRFHYTWHWFFDTGNGDLGNQGIHEVDNARWGLGVGFPNKVSAIGGKFVFDDDQETPNVINCAYEFNMPDGKKRMMEMEVRHWMTNHEAEIGSGAFGASDIPAAGLDVAAKPAAGGAPAKASGAGKHNTIGNIYYGSKGYLALQEYNSYRTWLGDNMEPGPSGKGRDNHYANFIDCVRSRNADNLNAPAKEAHMSAALVHLANASYRLGRTLHFDPVTELVIGDAEANRLLREEDRGYRKGFEIPKIAAAKSGSAHSTAGA
jgi:predicted dehydrogenase